MAPEMWAILVAAGASSRAGGQIPKQFKHLAGLPMYLWALHALRAGGAQGVVIAAPRNSLARVRAESGSAGPVEVVEGGARRRDSVANAMAAVPPRAELILVHDAARPFVPRSLPGRVAEACLVEGMALPVLPVPDTVKRSDDGRRVLETVDRRGLFLAQTPQACRRDVLSRIVALEQDLEFTDEAQGAEGLGIRPRLVTGSPFAFKITTDADLAMADAIARWLKSSWRDHEDWHWVRHTPPG